MNHIDLPKEEQEFWYNQNHPMNTQNTQECKATHTPTPWRFEYSEPDNRFILHRVKNGAFGHFRGWSCDGVTEESEDHANAQFIVRACNAHEELLCACKMALVQIRQDNDERKAEHRLTQYQLEAAIRNAEANL